jgi:hypothetical protein
MRKASLIRKSWQKSYKISSQVLADDVHEARIFCIIYRKAVASESLWTIVSSLWIRSMPQMKMQKMLLRHQHEGLEGDVTVLVSLGNGTCIPLTGLSAELEVLHQSSVVHGEQGRLVVLILTAATRRPCNDQVLVAMWA